MTTQVPATSVIVAPGSRLEELLAVYDPLEAAANEAEARFKTVKEGVKFELTTAAPDFQKIDVAHSSLAVPLRLIWVPRWELDTKRLKAEDPETYVHYARQSGRWELRRSRA